MIVNIHMWYERNKCSVVELPDRIGENIEYYLDQFYQYAVSGQICEEFYTYAIDYVDDRMSDSEKISGFLYYLYLYHFKKGENYTVIAENAPLDPQYKSVKL